MSAGWVAGSVRAQAMAHRRIGSGGARALAGATSLAEAFDAIARSPYGARMAGAERSVEAASRAVAETLLWNLRVLAGWLPPQGAELLRLLAGWFEIANVDELVYSFAGGAALPPYRLGTLATSWPQLSTAGSPAELRAGLGASPWRDPGGEAPRDIQLGMRLAYAERVATRIEPARPWAAAATALVVARERFVRGQQLPPGAAMTADRMLGAPAAGATALAEFAAALPTRAAWVLDDVRDSQELWRAELRWWHRLASDGRSLVAGSGFGPPAVVGSAAMLAADAWLVRAALEIAARGGSAMEVLDAVA